MQNQPQSTASQSTSPQSGTPQPVNSQPTVAQSASPSASTYQKSAEPLYDGKASLLWEVVGHPELLIIERKDQVTKLDGAVKAQIEGKGTYTNRIANILFRHLEKNGIRTHYVQELSANETLIRKAEQLKAEVIVRNFATGSLCKRLPIKDRTELKEPLVEIDYKSDEYGDPLINDQHALLLGVVKNQFELNAIKQIALDANTALRNFFWRLGIILVDFKLEFGRLPNGKIIIIDEISPDTCRFWDAQTGKSLDKDIFRRDEGTNATSAAYQEVLERMIADDATGPAVTINPDDEPAGPTDSQSVAKPADADIGPTPLPYAVETPDSSEPPFDPDPPSRPADVAADAETDK